MANNDGYVEEETNYNYTPLFSVISGNLSIGAPVRNELLTTFGNPDLITQLKNPNNNQVVEPVLSAGGYILGTDIILGSLSTTTFLSNTVGTYIYNNLSVSGNINNNNLTSALNSKATTTQLSDLDYTISAKADQTDLITNYYNKLQADSLVQGKANANNVYSIGQVDGFLTQKANASDLNNKVNGSDVYLRSEAELTCRTKSDMSNYATFEDLSNFETTVSMLGNVYQTITGMSSYITSGTLINNYATQLELSEKVDYTVFEQQLNIARDSAISNAYAYTDNKLTNYITTFSPLSGTYLSILDGANTYPTSTQLSTTLDLYFSKDLAADTFQDLAGMINYLGVDTASSTYQRIGNYITTFSPLSGTYLSIIDASSTYQTKADMTNYITSGSLSSYQTKADMNSYATSGSIVTNYQTRLSSITTSSGFSGSYVPLISRKVSNNTQYITTLGFPTSSLYGYAYNLDTSFVTLDDSNFYSTFYTQAQSDAKYQLISNMSSYALKNNPTFTGNVSTSSISVNGTDTSLLYQPRFNIATRFSMNSSGTVTLFYNFGIAPITQSNLVRTGVGAYSITGLNGFIAGGNMAFGGNGFTSVGNRVSTSFPSFDRLNVFLFNPAGTAVDGDVCVFTIP